MKYIFTFTLSLLISSLAYSQAPFNIPLNEQHETFSRIVTTPEKGNRQFVSEWFNYGASVYSLGGNCDYYRNYLFPDSTVVTSFSSSMGSVWKHSYGQMCDPSSVNYINNTLIDNDADYTLDSLLIWYKYYRFQNAAPDTVIVQVYEDDKIGFATDQWTDLLEYGNLNYDYQLRKGALPSYEYTILLDENDTTTATQYGLLIPVGINVAAGKKVAATVTYFPGNPFTPGDTIDPTIPVTNRVNAFAIYDYKDLDKDQNQGCYDNGMLLPSDVRYNYNTNGWNGQYIAGNAYNSGYYYLDMEFKLTSNSVGTENLSGTAYNINLFPSLITEKQNTMLQLQSGLAGSALISIIDLSGKKVYESAEVVQPGTTKFILPIESVSSGMFLVNVEMNGIKQTMKLIKI